MAAARRPVPRQECVPFLLGGGEVGLRGDGDRKGRGGGCWDGVVGTAVRQECLPPEGGGKEGESGGGARGGRSALNRMGMGIHFHPSLANSGALLLLGGEAGGGRF